MHIWEFHPALVHFPIAFLLAAVALDLYGLARPKGILDRMAAGLYVAGVAGGILAAAAGVAAWFTVPHPGEAHALMLWHPGLALASMAVFAVVAVRRWKGRAQPEGPRLRALGVLGAILLLAAGALGGHLVYRDAVGVSGPGLPEAEGPRPPSAEEVLKKGAHDGHGH